MLMVAMRSDFMRDRFEQIRDCLLEFSVTTILTTFNHVPEADQMNK